MTANREVMAMLLALRRPREREIPAPDPARPLELTGADSLQEASIMPNVNRIYQSQFLNAAQLRGQSRRVTIEGATEEVLGQGERAANKIILKFHDVRPRLPLNKTNALTIANAWGPDTPPWIGHVIELVPQRVLFQGAYVDSIRINIPRDGPGEQPEALDAPDASESVTVPTRAAASKRSRSSPKRKDEVLAADEALDGGLADMQDDVPW
jgi:hypothetical protein